MKIVGKPLVAAAVIPSTNSSPVLFESQGPALLTTQPHLVEWATIMLKKCGGIVSLLDIRNVVVLYLF